MEDVNVMQGFQALDHLDENAPDVLLSQIRLILLVPSDLLEQVPIVRVFHNDAINRMSKSVTFRR